MGQNKVAYQKSAKTGPRKAVFNKQRETKAKKPVPGNIQFYFAKKRLQDFDSDCLFDGPVLGLQDGGNGSQNYTKIKRLKLDGNAESESSGIKPKFGGQGD